MSERVVMNSDDIRRSLARIAHEIIERNRDMENMVLVGMRTRGVPLACRLSSNLERFENVHVPVGALDISFYRDDVPIESRLNTDVSGRGLVFNGTEMPVEVEGRSVVLVDDVLYTGRTVRAAMNELFDYGRPERIELAVLIDRGGRELPIQPTVVGRRIEVPEEISVVLSRDDDGRLHLTLEERRDS